MKLHSIILLVFLFSIPLFSQIGKNLPDFNNDAQGFIEEARYLFNHPHELNYDDFATRFDKWHINIEKLYSELSKVHIVANLSTNTDKVYNNYLKFIDQYDFSELDKLSINMKKLYTLKRVIEKESERIDKYHQGNMWWQNLSYAGPVIASQLTIELLAFDKQMSPVQNSTYGSFAWAVPLTLDNNLLMTIGHFQGLAGFIEYDILNSWSDVHAVDPFRVYASSGLIINNYSVRKLLIGLTGRLRLWKGLTYVMGFYQQFYLSRDGIYYTEAAHQTQTPRLGLEWNINY